MMKNVLLIISGPSGVGKGTIVHSLMAGDPNVCFSISCTTRAPRPGETDKKDYFFITKEAFKQKIAEDGFLEYSEHFDNFYGTPKDFVFEKLKTGDVILEIDVDGGLSVKKKFPSAVLIMIVPPSLDVLKERLKGRGTEDEEKIEKRLSRYLYEVGKSSEYDYVVVNNDLEKAISDVKEILNKEKNK